MAIKTETVDSEGKGWRELGSISANIIYRLKGTAEIIDKIIDYGTFTESSSIDDTITILTKETTEDDSVCDIEDIELAEKKRKFLTELIKNLKVEEQETDYIPKHLKSHLTEPMERKLNKSQNFELKETMVDILEDIDAYLAGLDIEATFLAKIDTDWDSYNDENLIEVEVETENRQEWSKIRDHIEDLAVSHVQKKDFMIYTFVSQKS